MTWETELYNILNFFPQWVWAWALLCALLGVAFKEHKQ